MPIQVSHSLIFGPKEGLIFVAPLPHPRRSIFTFIHPLSSMVWVAVLVCLPIVQVALYVVAMLEERLIGRQLQTWSKPGRAAWYGFKTLLGESTTRDAKSEGAWALRGVFNCKELPLPMYVVDN